ncbi:Polycystin-1 [Manis javanica]|nr:Polycystin-1 [Manis javanica]
MEGPRPSELGAVPPALMVASGAYHLSSATHAHPHALPCMLDEEPLTLVGKEIVAQGKRSDLRSLLCRVLGPWLLLHPHGLQRGPVQPHRRGAAHLPRRL